MHERTLALEQEYRAFTRRWGLEDDGERLRLRHDVPEHFDDVVSTPYAHGAGAKEDDRVGRGPRVVDD